ncbi:MAG: cadmium-translocating P-type ATPase [Candidatus Thorarchaeota archaeon]|nr:MAG: cadmium-translocating P-type ATPase [Candidatus Thorarchaeota archaeon]
MLVESEQSCSHCAGHEEEDSSSDIRQKYVIAALSTPAWTLAIVSDFILFNAPAVYILSLATMLLAGRWIIPRGIRGAANIHLDINFLMTFAAFAALVIGAPLEGASAMYLFFVANLLEDKARAQVRDDIGSLLELAPPQISVKLSSKVVSVPVESGQIGEIMVVKPGERIGLDGQVVSGASTVNQSPITGESAPVPKDVGDEVFAGTINLDGYIEVEINRVSQETVLSRIVKLVDEAREKRSPAETLVSRFSHVYTPLVVVGSLLVVLLTFFLLQSTPEAAIYRGLTLLVTSCPCAFVISIPVSMVSSIAGSARNGVLVKGSEYIEALSKTSVVSFDKTGTLTSGEPSVNRVIAYNGTTELEVLEIAASLEQLSEHPISTAILQAASIDSFSMGEITEFEVLPGRGIVGQLDGHSISVGNSSLMVIKGIAVEEDMQPTLGTKVYVARDKLHIGTIILSDTVRPRAKATIEALKRMNIRTVMLTGDTEATAKNVAELLGIDEYRAELLPHEKVAAVEALPGNGTRVMVGDGINDAPAMAASDVAVAMGVMGSDLALETADVALMKDDLEEVPLLIHQAKRTMRIVKQNIGMSIGVKGIIAVLATLGLATLWMAVGIGDMGLSLIVIANALRLAFRR